MVCTKQTTHKQTGSGLLLLVRMPVPPSGCGCGSANGSASQSVEIKVEVEGHQQGDKNSLCPGGTSPASSRVLVQSLDCSNILENQATEQTNKQKILLYSSSSS